MDLIHAQWAKSSYSGDNGGACVEVARNLPGRVAVRDSKDPGGPALAFGRAEWVSFLDLLKAVQG
jgi:hypothetical protein